MFVVRSPGHRSQLLYSPLVTRYSPPQVDTKQIAFRATVAKALRIGCLIQFCKSNSTCFGDESAPGRIHANAIRLIGPNKSQWLQLALAWSTCLKHLKHHQELRKWMLLSSLLQLSCGLHSALTGPRTCRKRKSRWPNCRILSSHYPHFHFKTWSTTHLDTFLQAPPGFAHGSSMEFCTTDTTSVWTADQSSVKKYLDKPERLSKTLGSMLFWAGLLGADQSLWRGVALLHQERFLSGTACWKVEFFHVPPKEQQTNEKHDGILNLFTCRIHIEFVSCHGYREWGQF